MTPEELLNQSVENLMNQLGCSWDEALSIALENSSHLADEADISQHRKQEIEWEIWQSLETNPSINYLDEENLIE